MTFLPLVGLDLLVSLLLLRVWKSKKESVVDPEAHSCRSHTTCHRETYAWQTSDTPDVLVPPVSFNGGGSGKSRSVS